MAQFIVEQAGAIVWQETTDTPGDLSLIPAEYLDNEQVTVETIVKIDDEIISVVVPYVAD
jgi:hypothetical protein